MAPLTYHIRTNSTFYSSISISLSTTEISQIITKLLSKGLYLCDDDVQVTSRHRIKDIWRMSSLSVFMKKDNRVEKYRVTSFIYQRWFQMASLPIKSLHISLIHGLSWRLRGLAVACWTTDHYNLSEVARPIYPTVCTKVAVNHQSPLPSSSSSPSSWHQKE